jgi:hypothetical protein
MKLLLCRLALPLLCLSSLALGEDVVMKAMRDELSRSVAQLRLADLDKPYFIAYRVDDNAITKISATLGQLTDENLYRGRTLDVQVRVGNFTLDNTNFMAFRSETFGGGSCGCHSTLPIDDDYAQIRREIWLATDAEYKQSASALGAKRSVLEHRQRGHELPDFIPQAPTSLSAKEIDLKVDVPALERLARELSNLFRESPEILTSGVYIYIANNYVRFVNSEGTVFSRDNPLVALDVRASTQAQDGQPLRDSFRVYGNAPDKLRSDELLARTRSFIAQLKALRLAKSLETYNGPVLFEQQASAELIAEVFAPAVVAARTPISDEPQFEAQFQQMLNQLGGTLADRVGGRVLPEGFDLIDDPRTTRIGDQLLMGSREIDDEGSVTREVKIVENGTLKSLLSSRTPTPQTKASTGSVRGFGAAPSNLFLKVNKSQTGAELHKELLRIAKQRGYDFGVVVRSTGDASLSAFTRLSFRGNASSGMAVYKVFADGHEELARAEIAPVPLTSFKDIRAAGDKPAIHHQAFMPVAGSFLARAGGGNSYRNFVVASYSVPSLLFEEISLKPLQGAAPKLPVVPSPIAQLK